MKKRFIEERRRYIASRFSELNDMQVKAVMATEGPLLILAGAGSGKTTVLINRIANLLAYGRASDSEELPDGPGDNALEILRSGGERADAAAALCPVEPWRILAITFTNKAAGELKQRLEIMLGESANDIWACTFHSACVRILRRDAERLGYPSAFTIYDTSDSQSLAKHILRDMNIDEKLLPHKSALAAVSRAKDEKIGAAEYLAQAKALDDARSIKIGEFYVEYARRLFAAGAMDFDDLIYNTVILLEQNSDVREYWQKRFRYVLIDEYQDTNHIQYLLSALLAGGHRNLCVVGDDDQSIYKFRGATIENILSFEEQFKGCRTIRLEQNYRSTQHILNAANSVIRHNLGRKGKELWTKADMGDKVKVTQVDNEHDEAQRVASAIIANYSHGGNWRDNAVLYRMNAQSNQLEYAFKRNSIPYRLIGGTRFFDRAEIKDMLAYLCVIASPDDDMRLTRIINVPVRGIGEKSVVTAQGIADDNNTSLFEILRKADLFPELSRPALRMRQFAQMMDELREFAKDSTPDVLLDELIEKTGYIRALEQKNTAEDTARIENVQELKSAMIGYMKESGDTTLEGYLANVALYTDLDNYDPDADAVVMMTMHSAKGLEFPHVFLVGMEESIFPGMRAIGEHEEMEEERRLCYVAVTRAKKTLEMIHARQRMIFGRTVVNKASRFIDEMDEDDLERDVPKQRFSGGMSEFAHKTSRPVPASHAYVRAAAEVPAPESDFALGDSVRHRAFGDGVITKMTPMGGDFLVEISFASQGVKKLMLRTASAFLTKNKG
ncbi:MAG: UvrD-helicase domain-containing protein [Eubacteriales bacterium]|nr:UvrD-helicase domain-containing protein [Eubacteriales bacterium]